MLGRMWRKRNASKLLEMQVDTARYSMSICNILLGALLLIIVALLIIALLIIAQGTDSINKNVAHIYIYSGILPRYKYEGTIVICDNMNELVENYAKKNKPDTERLQHRLAMWHCR